MESQASVERALREVVSAPVESEIQVCARHDVQHLRLRFGIASESAAYLI